MIKLRTYQTEAIEQTFKALQDGSRAPLIVTPTGSGKSVILADFIRQALAHPTTSVLVVTHVKELVQQDYEKIKLLCPKADVGVYSAGLSRREISQITVASIQSIYNKEMFHGRFDIIIVDEAHLIPHTESGMYRKLIDKSRALHPNTVLVGLTATPYRLVSGMLHEGQGALFDCIAYEADIKSLMDQGFLSPLVSIEAAEADVKGIKKTGGDFNQLELGTRYSAQALIQNHCMEIVKASKGRNSWLIFCVTVDHAMKVAHELQTAHNISTAVVSGETPDHERDAIIEGFKLGVYQALVNCSVLTTGFDHPGVDVVAMLRPTMSPGLYVQMVGRGLRIAEGKKNCMVLDFGGNVIRHGFVDQVRPPNKKKKTDGVQPVKKCPQCRTLNAINAKECVGCGFVFPVAEREAYDQAYKGSMLSNRKNGATENYAVNHMNFKQHIAKSGKPTLKVTYLCGVKTFAEYVNLEHEGYARTKAVQWWKAHTKQDTAPLTVLEALTMLKSIEQPTHIAVAINAQGWPEIKAKTFKDRLDAPSLKVASVNKLLEFPAFSDHEVSTPFVLGVK